VDTTTFTPADPEALETLRLSCEVLEQAQRCGRPAVMAQAALGVACCWRGLHETDAAVHYLQRALAWARVAQAHDAVVEVLCELCDVLAQQAQDERDPGIAHATRERVRDIVFEVAGRAAHVADGDWEVKVLLHVSDVLNRLGDHDDASTLQARALRLMSGAPVRHDPSVLPSIGRLAS
jgi:hypothetical protein